MKVIFVFSVFVGLAAAAAIEQKFMDECKEETGLSVENVGGYLTDDDDSNDADATKYMMCIFKKAEVIDDDGHLDVEKAQENAKDYLKEFGGSDDQETLDCIKEKDDIEDTVLSIAKCVEKRKVELSDSK